MTTTRPDAQAVRDRVLRQLSTSACAAIESIVAAAAPSDLYAVGGIVRDALLGRATTDIDLAVEGDAIAIMRMALPSARLTTHLRFGTVSTRIDDIEIDLAMTRTETYARPGSLPNVMPGSTDADLRRRDFRMNAIALRLSGNAEILDPSGGLADIEARTVRVLHERSFDDDPTRIYRALRYAARLGFTIESDTRTGLLAALPHVAELSPARLRRELELMLLEPTADKALTTADEAGALAAVHSRVGWPRTAAPTVAFTSERERLAMGFALLASGASRDEASAIVARLRLQRHEASAVEAMPALRAAGSMLRRPNAKPSGVVQVLDRYPVPAVAALAMASSDRVVATVARRYLEEWRFVKPLLHGSDLEMLGVPEGPQLQQGLDLIRASRLDGWVDDEGDERALALRFAKSIRDSAAAKLDIEMGTNGR
jgi:tRNA nucleotidyltransferase (CCA-adding enzyme)